MFHDRRDTLSITTALEYSETSWTGCHPVVAVCSYHGWWVGSPLVHGLSVFFAARSIASKFAAMSTTVFVEISQGLRFHQKKSTVHCSFCTKIHDHNLSIGKATDRKSNYGWRQRKWTTQRRAGEAMQESGRLLTKRESYCCSHNYLGT